MSSCKCGAVKITKLTGTVRAEFKIGCPYCKTTAVKRS